MHDATPHPAPRRPRWHRIGIGLTLSLVTTYAVLEVALRMFPAVLPMAYRESYPFHGLDLFHPHLLDETPLDRLPLPIVASTWTGPPPRDLVVMGTAPPAAALQDVERYPDLVAPVDDLGLPNLKRPATAEFVLVGDSFLVSAGVTRPPGMALRLAERTGRTVYNVGISGSGPHQELAVLRQVGMPMRPKVVLWFFFGGNDLADAYAYRFLTRDGAKNWGEAFADRRVPFLRVPDLVSFLRAPRAAAEDSPLAPLRLPSPRGETRPIWFHGPYLSQLVVPREEVERLKVWGFATEVLRRAREEAEAGGARFVLAFLPSKAQVYLPFVESDPELLFAMSRRGAKSPPETTPAAFEVDALAHRAAVEKALAGFAADEGMLFFSATPALEDLARRGELGYLTADTHWQTEGQAAVLGPLLEFLREAGLLGS